jgi:hypothetical protein
LSPLRISHPLPTNRKTKTTNLLIMKEIENKIRKALPYLQNIEANCLIDDYHGIKKIIYVSREINNIILLDVFCNSTGFDRWKMTKGVLTTKINDKDVQFKYNVIGREIMLNDVLKWFIIESKNIEDVICRWDLRHPYLKDQSKELIKYLKT